MRALGIDIGTTKIAAVTVDVSSGAVVRIASAATPTLPSTRDGEHIQDASAIVSLVRQMIDGVGLDDLCAIGISGQMHGIVYLDAAGETVSPLYTWQDVRGGEISPGGVSYAELLGSKPGYGHATHAYNLEHGLVPTDAHGYATIADAVCAALCELREPILHATSAASLGCFDIERSRFTSVLPAPYPYAVVGGYHIAGTYHGIPVAVGIGDNQASFLGSGCGEGEALVNIGTGSQISLLSEHPMNNQSVETRPAFEGKYLLVGAALCGGRAYALLNRFFCDVVEMATGQRPSDVYDAMAGYQKNAADASLRFDNAFCGTRSDPGRRGSICGISEQNFTPSEFCIGSLEGIVDELAVLFFEMGCGVEGMVGAGNALRKNPLLQKLCEKRFGTHLWMPGYTEEAAVGAALFALISTGTISDMAGARALMRQKDTYNL